MKGRLLIGLLLGALFLFLSLRQVDIGVTWETLRRADYRYFLLFLSLNLFAIWLRAVRWGYLLRPI